MATKATAAKTTGPAAKSAGKKETEASTEVAVRANNAVAVGNFDMENDAGGGMEGTTQEAFAIPFIVTLQSNSPQVDEASGSAIEGAKAGMFYENVTGRLFDGRTKGITIVPCAFRRVFLHWGARGTDAAGFKGELTPEQAAELRQKGKVVELDGKLFFPLPDGTVNDKKCDRLNDTRNHYVLLVDDETGSWVQAVLSLSSTQIKKSKNLMSALASVKVKGANGLYTPPTFGNLVKLTTVAESNDKGNWFGIVPKLAGLVDSKELYAAAKAFHATVARGGVEVKYEDTEGAGAAGGGRGGDPRPEDEGGAF